jgi:hypothetical protein
MASTTASWWQYSRWTYIIARTMRFNPPAGAELAALRAFLKVLWDPATNTGTRPWLADVFRKRCGSAQADYNGDIDTNAPYPLAVMLDRAARNLKVVPLTDAEAAACDTLFAATGYRRYGTQGNLI